ncbi:MAG: glycoside hydrolase family 172 protein, partial [Phycisphaerales bacterium]
SPAFRTVQFSSHDRRSNLPGGPNWFANSDGFGGEPIPNFEKVLRAPDANGVGEYLIADVNGPGAIVRLWTAAISGQVRVYLDDAQNPLFEGSADDFFHRPYDRFARMKSIDADRFRRTIYQRDASYAPIPFAKRLRAVWTGNVKEIHFYELQVRLYDPQASVVSFRPEDIQEYCETIDKVTAILSDPEMSVSRDLQQQPNAFDLSLKPEQNSTLARLQGPAAVARLSLRLTAADLDKALRQTLLSITFDDYPWGQVQSPVGDFFGAAPGVNPYQSLPFTVQPDGMMTCRFVMPFERSGRVELRNLGDQTIGARGSVQTIPFAWDERAMHFRARWRADHDVIASNREVQDLPFLLAQGRGVYVGTGVYLMNPSPIPTPGGSWWGEGDEKIFIDGEATPSTFGTGSEDYFNYSWSSPDIFTYPYCGQPRNDGPGNRGYVTNYRWHVLDSLPFQDSIRFYMELYSHERLPGMSYARIGYHYARPGVTDDHLALMPKDLRLVPLPENWQPAARGGASNSVFFQAEEVVADPTNTRLQEARIWAGGKTLLWTPQKKGERKSFRIAVAASGKRQIHVAFGQTPHSGRVGFYLDNQPLTLADKADSLDLRCPCGTLLRSFDLTPVDLRSGDHVLAIESLDEPDSAGRPEIGVDFIWIQER